jgi:hypothetical protein
MQFLKIEIIAHDYVSMAHKVVLVMNSFCIENLSKLVDKLIACVLFLTSLELNTVNKENKTRYNSYGTIDRSNDDQSFGNANPFFFHK